ncbi:hypothetical protein [Paeniglutamicibacter cryotolerans]|uniref:Uncharacterized protein n=1 Tax=Paeniglutamicibacter cryotolerans TaxID=670079 RepID=A0A839QXW1_9MICC|nr:hypothetical protein [Paeniglutamicibacter cryotolerans]MBB2996801.1 hypothetical protein [Paeniglutamicibacter cryotolerans]
MPSAGAHASIHSTPISLAIQRAEDRSESVVGYAAPHAAEHTIGKNDPAAAVWVMERSKD